jgi:hypothetical protein
MTDKIIPSPTVEDVKTDLDINMDGFFIRQTQEIPDWYLRQLEDHKHESARRPEGDFMRLASIPVGIIESWMRQGFDVYREKPQAIIKRLQHEGYDKLITTAKRIG